MTRQEKADRIHKLLDALYPEIPVPLDHTDPYTLLIAVLLLTCPPRHLFGVQHAVWRHRRLRRTNTQHIHAFGAIA